MSELPHVALLIETSRDYGRSILRGIKRYLSTQARWSVYLERRDLRSSVPPWLKRWRGDGILARTDTQEMADAIRRTRAPVVELRHAMFLNHQASYVTMENAMAGRLVADYFLEHGLRHFAYYNVKAKEYHAYDERRDGFVERLAAQGHTCSEFATVNNKEIAADWEKQQNALARWVRKLPKPIGILASSDQFGFWLLDACHRAGVAVPEEAAVVGAENDELLCSMATPNLSSVNCNAEEIGYQAAALLARLMRGEAPPKEPLRIPPLGIVTRQSSDIIAIDDQEIASAARYIREHACEGISVDDVVAATYLSRSTLERRMRAALHRSPKAEITRVQLTRVKELLEQTELPLHAIAERAGFRHPQHMSELFKTVFHETPGNYRLLARRSQVHAPGEAAGGLGSHSSLESTFKERTEFHHPKTSSPGRKP